MSAKYNIEVFKILLNNNPKGRTTFKNVFTDISRNNSEDCSCLFNEFYLSIENRIINRKKTRLEVYKEIFLKEHKSIIETNFPHLCQENDKKVIRGEITRKFKFYLYTPLNYDVGVIFISHDPTNDYYITFLNHIESVLACKKGHKNTRIEKYSPKNLTTELADSCHNTQDIDFNSNLTSSILYKLSIIYSCRVTDRLINVA